MLGLSYHTKIQERGASMFNSIQYFQQEGIKKLQKVFESYQNDFFKLAEMVYGVTEEVTKLGCSMIAEEWESYDEILRERKDLRRGWHVVRKDETMITTSLGDVTYSRTLFKNIKTGVSCYLLDKLIAIEPHTRMSEDAVARILEEAVDSTYRKGGANASISGSVMSKETVMNKLHMLEFPKTLHQGEKKIVEKLYIDADEDHVSLQYLVKKGDIKKPRTNTVMPRLAYVYEGVDVEETGKPKLINAKYFGGVYEGTSGVNDFWKEVNDYIESAYDTEKIEQIYINGDGANWIKTGTSVMPKSKFVLDKFHMHKYIITATSHLGDSAEDARSEIYRAIHRTGKKACEAIFDYIIDVTDIESKKKAVETSKGYILSNWRGIQISIKGKDKNIQCSAEGHVSHIFADRMSSRPLGWSKQGCDKMARLRVYQKNGGNMLELVRYQAEEIPMAVGAEEVIYSASEMITMENRSKQRLGSMADMPVYEIPYPQIKKIAAIKNHIWGL